MRYVAIYYHPEGEIWLRSEEHPDFDAAHDSFERNVEGVLVLDEGETRMLAANLDELLDKQAGLTLRRANAQSIFDHPENWYDPEARRR